MFYSKEDDQIQKVIDAVRSSIANQKRIIELLSAQTQYITQSIQTQNDTIQQQNGTIEKQHETIVRFQNDVLLKSQKDLIMELIGIADNVNAILASQKEHQDYDKLLEDVSQLALWVDKSLETAAVRSFSDASHSKVFNPHRQEVKENIPVTHPEEDGQTVSIQKGYVWSIPWLIVNSEVQLQNIVRDNPEARTFQFVLRPELVARKKYDNDLNNSAEQ